MLQKKRLALAKVFGLQRLATAEYVVYGRIVADLGVGHREIAVDRGERRPLVQAKTEVLRVPQSMILEAQNSVSVTFSPSARPGQSFELQDLRVAPATTVVDNKNVFLCEATTHASLDRLPPGMEGVARVSVGYKPVWWTLTHRILGWLKLNFWL